MKISARVYIYIYTYIYIYIYNFGDLDETWMIMIKFIFNMSEKES